MYADGPALLTLLLSTISLSTWRCYAVDAGRSGTNLTRRVVADSDAKGLGDITDHGGRGHALVGAHGSIILRDQTKEGWVFKAPAGVVAQDSKSAHVTIISGWMLLHVLGNHTSALRQPELPWLVSSLRNAVADCLGLCRPAIGIVDIRAVSVDIVDPRPVGFGLKDIEDRLNIATPRLARSGVDDYFNHRTNVTQLRAVYEVRIFDEMNVNEAEVARRIDQLQIYGKYTELSRMLQHSFAKSGVDDNVMLDDVGYASRHVLQRPLLHSQDISDCTEEVLLKNARRAHQLVLLFSFLMIACIACAGSAVFTIKQPSMVPSRLNSLSDGVPY